MIIKGKYRITTRGWVVFSGLFIVILIVLLQLGSLLFGTKVNEDKPLENDINVDKSEVTETATDEEKQEEDSSSELVDTESPLISEETAVVGEEEDVSDSESNSDEEEASVEIDEEYKKIFYTIYFKPNGSNLDSSFHDGLNDLIGFMSEKEELVIAIEGNMNAYPNIEVTSNGVELSMKRAEVVKKYLLDHGISEDIIKLINNGADKPLVTEGKAKDFVANRRADVYILKKE